MVAPRTVSPALALLSVLASGCYLSHERPFDDTEECAFSGVYSVTQRVVASTCETPGEIEVLDVTIPPDRRMFGVTDAVRIRRVDLCGWEIDVDEALPDAWITLDGWVEASDGRVRGAFAITSVGVTGRDCTTSLEWSPRE